MSELLQNRPVARDKLSAALKRNMARRKAVAAGGKPVEASERPVPAATQRAPNAGAVHVPAAKGGAA